MSGGDPRAEFLYNLPSPVLWEFCRIMNGLSDLDWTGFASAVLDDQTSMRLAERKERRTEEVMNHWAMRNGRVGDLIDLLEYLQLLHPRDVILAWTSRLNPSSSAPPPPARPPPGHSQLDPPAKEPKAPPTLSTCRLSTTVDKGGGRSLPGPAPPPPSLWSDVHRHPQPPNMAPCSSSSAAMCWSYEEVHAGTDGFSPSLRVGEGGFGVVYKASLRNIDCAIKRLKQDSELDWTLLRDSFQTEVEKLSKFRHPHIVELLGFSEGRGSMCLIYSFMENGSLEEQLHNECVFLSWPQRLSIIEGASAALQFLHSPPEGQKPLIHGDVKSSNVLLDRHLVAKLSDFGLARFVSRGPPSCSLTQTASLGKTTTVRGTLAYLPDEYVRKGALGPAVDVYSFGVVLLEVLTGRQAQEKDKKSGERFLKDLVEEVKDGPTGSSPEAWRKHLDQRLMAGGAAEPAGCLQVVDLACRSLDRNWKKRPAMTEMFKKLHKIVRETSSSSSSSPSPSSSSPSPPSSSSSSSSSYRHTPPFQPPYQSFPRSPCSLDSSVGSLSQQLSKLGPLEDTYQPSSSSSSSSSFCSLTPPHPLHSSSSLPPLSSASFVGPCETDESRGFSQYDLRSQSRSNGTSCRSLSPSTRDQYHRPTGHMASQCSQRSVPTEDQYNFPPQPNGTSERMEPRTLTGATAGPDTRGQQTTAGTTAGPTAGPTAGTTAGPTAGFCGFSPAGSLQSTSPGPSVHMNPRKQRLLDKKTQYEEGRIRTPELLSSDDLYEGSPVDLRGPEESDELDYLPSEHH